MVQKNRIEKRLTCQKCKSHSLNPKFWLLKLKMLKLTLRHVLMWQKIKNYYHLLQAAGSAVFFNFPSNHITVIGVTGTDGKTTTVHMIYEILKASGQKASMVSSIYAAIGSKTYDTGLHITTPSAWHIQKLLRRAVDAGHRYFVLETTSHGLDQNRLAFTKVEVGVLTNITHEHLDYHKSWPKYATAKLKLLKMAKFSIINSDDEKSFSIISKKLYTTPISYSLQGKSDFNLKNTGITLKIPGLYNLSNALAAFAATAILGIPKPKIKKALLNYSGTRGRMDKINLKQNFEVVVDFAHTPNALEQALITLKSRIDGRSSKVIAVFGAASQRDIKKRPLMGAVADKLADVVVLTAEDPRNEDPMVITAQIKNGMQNKKAGHDLFEIPNRSEAINYAVQIANPGDIVALFGKGHEKSMAIKGVETPWDEYEAARIAIRRKNAKK